MSIGVILDMIFLSEYKFSKKQNKLIIIRVCKKNAKCKHTPFNIGLTSPIYSKVFFFSKNLGEEAPPPSPNSGEGLV